MQPGRVEVSLPQGYGQGPSRCWRDRSPASVWPVRVACACVDGVRRRLGPPERTSTADPGAHQDLAIAVIQQPLAGLQVVRFLRQLPPESIG